MRVLYLHGFASGPSSSKAQFFASRLREFGVELEIPDLAGGDFEHLTITKQLHVIERDAAGERLIVMGSSMGGYLAALYAARHPEIERLVLFAPAFGFAKRWPAVLGEAVMREWRATGHHTVFHYGEGRECRLSYELITDAERYEDYPEVRQPTLVLHGVRDDVVPAEASLEFGRRHARAKVVLFDSGHELTDVLEPMWTETRKFLGFGDAGVD